MTSRFLAVLSFVLLWAPGGRIYGSEPGTVRIEIKSSWGGLGEPTNGTLIITGHDGKFMANGRRVDEKPVQSLIAAVEQPLIEHPNLDECGITGRWLLANYEPALENYTHEKATGLSPKQVELFKERFTNPVDVQASFAELFKNWHTDDYPEVSVTVLASGKEFGVHSQSQYAFMLPWLGTDAARGGYSCEISRTLAALLPKKFANRERLVLGEGFRWRLADEVMRSIEHEWNLLDTEFKVGPAVAPIFAVYTPVKSAISNLSSIDLDGGQAWNAELRSNELPSNMFVGVSLRYYKKELFGTNRFLTQLPKYSNLVQSVPWLSAYLKMHPEVSVELRYVDGRSLSPKAQSRLTEDLRKHGKIELANSVAEQAADSAFLEVNVDSGCWSRAVVFPSGEILIWHFKCDSVLGFSAKDLEHWDYYGWQSTGTLVRKDGTLVR